VSCLKIGDDVLVALFGIKFTPVSRIYNLACLGGAAFRRGITCQPGYTASIASGENEFGHAAKARKYWY